MDVSDCVVQASIRLIGRGCTSTAGFCQNMCVTEIVLDLWFCNRQRCPRLAFQLPALCPNNEELQTCLAELSVSELKVLGNKTEHSWPRTSFKRHICAKPLAHLAYCFLVSR